LTVTEIDNIFPTPAGISQDSNLSLNTVGDPQLVNPKEVTVLGPIET
jgi:hypothetical protein